MGDLRSFTIATMSGKELMDGNILDEAGFESLQDTIQSKHTSAQYSEKAFVLSRQFVKAALHSDPQGFSDIIHWLYLPACNGRGLLRDIVKDCREFLQQGSNVSSEAKGQDRDSYHITSTRLSLGALALLKKIVVPLEEALELDDKIAAARPKGVEESPSELDRMEVDEN